MNEIKDTQNLVETNKISLTTSDFKNNHLNDIKNVIGGRKQVIQAFTGRTLNGKIKIILSKYEDRMIIINILHQNENQINQKEKLKN